MKVLLKVISFLGLACTVVPSILVLRGEIEWGLHATLMVLGMILWFASAPFWMKTGRE